MKFGALRQSPNRHRIAAGCNLPQKLIGARIAVKVTNINLSPAELIAPLYRIYPIWLFESALRVNGGNLTLVPPWMWDDPREDPCAKIQMRSPTFKTKMVGDYLRPVFAQSWSFEGESDALLRAYSRVTKDKLTGKNTDPRNEGVKVKTTPKALIDAILRFLEKRGRYPAEFYIGKVDYVDEPAQLVIKRLGDIGPTRMGRGPDRARSLTFKHRAFRHEQEVRIVAVAEPDFKAELLIVDVDKNAVFLELLFDPRLAEFERLERERQVKSQGFTGPVTHDLTYMTTFYDVPLPRDWDEIDASPGRQG